VLSSAQLEERRSGAQVRVAGLVVARQRPATANGVTFMLLEDECGTLNLIVPVPVYEKCRLAVRAEPIVIADGKLERREGVTNVVVSSVRRLERPDMPLGEVRHIEPRRIWSNDEAAGDLRAVVPAANSFGRGRG
jgi:error-prone DNA polymerase